MVHPTDPAAVTAVSKGGGSAPRVPAQGGSPEGRAEGNRRTGDTNLRLWQRNRAWWGSGVGFGAKLRYYGDMTASYVRAVRGRPRIVRYLDRPFAYDTMTTPLALQSCPREVGTDVLGNLRPGFRLRSVLDVGGHLGQFAVTLRHFAPGAEIDVFEPNGRILPHLEANTTALRGVRIWPYALGAHGAEEMFVDPDRSSTGSLIAGLVDCPGTPRRIPVRSIGDPSSVTGRQEYDLVRVAAAGAELDVLKCMAGMTVHYLYVELAGPRGIFPHSELLVLVRRQFGDFRIVFQGAADRRTPYVPLMLEFAGSPR
ncbi:hypothetical protein GCM10023205_28660 [Yinghuangia aomiensis]|uniref:Methyltransferase, FkbM family n=1 Tax=Yinghuangia aomiensis TaxID=676205 RepID=A0ABP9H7P3_9ACTN